MMATHASLTTKENVVVMKYLEDETLRLAKDRGFEGIFTTNTSPLTQVLISICLSKINNESRNYSIMCCVYIVQRGKQQVFSAKNLG